MIPNTLWGCLWKNIIFFHNTLAAGIKCLTLGHTSCVTGPSTNTVTGARILASKAENNTQLQTKDIKIVACPISSRNPGGGGGLQHKKGGDARRTS